MGGEDDRGDRGYAIGSGGKGSNRIGKGSGRLRMEDAYDYRDDFSPGTYDDAFAQGYALAMSKGKGKSKRSSPYSGKGSFDDRDAYANFGGDRKGKGKGKSGGKRGKGGKKGRDEQEAPDPKTLDSDLDKYFGKD